ncbi:hypothetical protein Clacol_006970 [Clathrus columnatus]|uniref:F-box domain-containing protein n=1 Tax=Clathrus columnatus TaxID=1419009 RepID=A0AAV5AJT3_9AGAM|nr:hypothetical protein Clacol_006970 [Clathrus columnatus]
MLVPINRLPVELFTHIVHLTSKKTRGKYPSYIICTWVCRHWRFILIQTPNLWTTLQLGTRGYGRSPPITLFDREFLKRSESAGLDIDLSYDSDEFLSMIEEFFIKESNRIHTLNYHGNLQRSLPLLLPNIRFPSIRKFVHRGSPLNNDLHYVLPCIAASDHLETLGLEFWHTIPTSILNQLTPIFTRLQKLSLTILPNGIAQIVLDALRNNTKLRTLRLIAFSIPAFNQIIWPELEFLSISDETLLQNVQAPKLSTLHLQCNHLPSTLKDNPILEEFDYSSVRYLHILNFGHESIIGLKETVHPKSVLSMTSEDFLDRVNRINGGGLFVDDVLSGAWKRGCFRLDFTTKEGFIQTLEGALSMIFSRLTGLSEICLMSDTLFENEGTHFENILIRIPSLEKLIVSGNALLDFIRRLCNAPLCPRMKYLSYHNNIVLEENENPYFAEDLGKLLVECLQSRYKLYRNVLEYIVLGNCPPLPGNWLDECKKLGTTVITERDLNRSTSIKCNDSDSKNSERYPDESEPGSEDEEEL